MTLRHPRYEVTMKVLPVIAAVLALSCGAPEAQQAILSNSQEAHFDAHERATLAGLTGVFVLLDGVSSDVDALGLHQAEVLQSVQDQLRTGGVHVLTRDEARSSSRLGPWISSSRCPAQQIQPSSRKRIRLSSGSRSIGNSGRLWSERRRHSATD